MRYKLNTGSSAWIFHRVTGVILAFYLLAHMFVISHVHKPEEFRAIMELMKNPFVKIGEVGLLAVVLAHALNGIRLTMLECGASTKMHKPMFYAALAAGAILFVMGALPFFVGGGH